MNDFPFIDIQHVTYTYPDQQSNRAAVREARAAVYQQVASLPALQDVSLQVGRGEYVVILGHNGSGKSTLARHCNALLSPGSGRVLVGGMDTADQANWRAIRDIVGMIFQNPDNQIIATVVEDDVAWALTVRGLPASLIRERVAYAMTAVGIADMGKLPPHQLSGGQRQRLAIAGVLALRPQCIIADEATAQLDPLSRMEIVTLLHQLRLEYGLTIIQVTHLLEEAALAERVVIMEQGQVVMDGDPASVFADLERLRRLKLAIPEPVELAARLRAAGSAGRYNPGGRTRKLRRHYRHYRLGQVDAGAAFQWLAAPYLWHCHRRWAECERGRRGPGPVAPASGHVVPVSGSATLRAHRLRRCCFWTPAYETRQARSANSRDPRAGDSGLASS